MSDKLKPCPFCGHEAEVRNDGEGLTREGEQPYWINCTFCQGNVDPFYTAEEAIDAWNERTHK